MSCYYLKTKEGYTPIIYPKLEIVNIKASLFVNKKVIINNLKTENNIYSFTIDNPKVNIFMLKNIRYNNIAYNSVVVTIYKHSTHLINITGAKSFTELEEMKQFIKTIFQCEIINKERIDALMLNYHSKISMNLNLNKIYVICKLVGKFFNFNVDFHPELFNALFFKSTIETGTMNIFSNGSIQVMGCKTEADRLFNQGIINIIITLYYLYNQLIKT